MALKTKSAFIYGHRVTEDNQFINFNEGGSELTATIEIGSYTITDFVNQIALALNSASSLVEFTVTLDRATRFITITGDGAFSLLVSSGSNSSQSAFPLMGFTGLDLTGASTYEGDSASGSIYMPQFNLQSFVDFGDDIEINESVVKITPSSIVEAIGYGESSFMSCNIKYITDIAQPIDAPIDNNANGVADFKDFRDYIIRKRPVEFLPNKNGRTFVKCILESTPESKEGTGLRLKELSFSGGPAFYFQTGNLKFRKVN